MNIVDIYNLFTFQEFLESKYLKDVMSKYGKIDFSESNLDPDFVPRSSYTNKIMDILKNVAKQKEETRRVWYMEKHIRKKSMI